MFGKLLFERKIIMSKYSNNDHSKAENDNRSNQLNPNNSAHSSSSNDNHANQMNPNNSAYESSRK